MDLIFVSTPHFSLGEEISNKIRSYFPNLIDDIEIIKSKSTPSYHLVNNLNKELEREIEPDWENEIVLKEVLGPVYWADMRLNNHACTMDSFGSDGNPTYQ